MESRAISSIVTTLRFMGLQIKLREAARLDGQCFVWLEPEVVNRLRAMRGPGESYSDVILRLVEIDAGLRPIL